MTKFKPGDRVACYSGTGRIVLKLTDIDSEGYLLFSYKDNPGHLEYEFHPKQCRKLKPKAKPREFWIMKHGPGCHLATAVLMSEPSFYYLCNCNGFEFIHVREVRKAKE